MNLISPGGSVSHRTVSNKRPRSRAIAGTETTTASAGSTTGRSPGGSTKTSVAGSAAGASGQSAAQKPVQIIFQGPVYGGQAGIDELVRHITQAVTERDVNLVAYTVVRQPTVRE